MITVAVGAAYTARLEGLFSDTSIAFRSQNGDAYDDELTLKPGLGQGATGLAPHRR